MCPGLHANGVALLAKSLRITDAKNMNAIGWLTPNPDHRRIATVSVSAPPWALASLAAPSISASAVSAASGAASAASAAPAGHAP